MYGNAATEMSRDRNGPTEWLRPKWIRPKRPDRMAQTEMAQTKTAQTESARPKSRVPDLNQVQNFDNLKLQTNVLYVKSISC